MPGPLSRRKFMETAALGAGLASISGGSIAGHPAQEKEKPEAKPPEGAPAAKPGLPRGKLPAPLAISTWKHGAAASRAAVRVLLVSGTPLDAVESGINVVEKDPRVDSVGVGGLPNEEGVVELDAAIMDGSLRCGAVMGLRDIATPISVARKVMERTRHIQLVGDGALQFAIEQEFQLAVLLTPESKAKWEAWKASPDRQVPGQVEKKASEGHDTVSTLVLDGHGGLAAGCSTSGLAWKLPGRVGDSPIVGAGLYCDGEVGAAAATGIGEEILRVCGSFLIVEGMRRGLSPQQAVEEALRRVARAHPDNRRRQVAFIALSRSGEVGAGAMLSGFQAAIATADGKELLVDVAPFTG